MALGYRYVHAIWHIYIVPLIALSNTQTTQTSEKKKKYVWNRKNWFRKFCGWMLFWSKIRFMFVH